MTAWAARAVRLAAALLVAALAATPVSAAAAPQPLGTIGAAGTGDGQFALPFAVAADAAGNLYVTDQTNSRVQKLAAGGSFLSKWGDPGELAGQFSSPAGIAVGPDGDVWVADSDNNHIDQFGPDGAFKGALLATTDPDSSFSHPIGLAVDQQGNIYVTSAEINHLDKFGPDGRFITDWGAFGQGPGQFSSPQGIAIGPDGSVYVADLLNKRVQKFTPTGGPLAQWPVFDPQDGTPDGPAGVAVDPTDGTVLVVDQDAGVVQRYTPTGDLIEAFGQGMLNRAWGIAVDCRGTVTVADSYNDRLVRFGDPAAAPPPCPAPPAGPPGPPAPGQGPTAAFTVAPNPTILGLPVTFDASGSTAPAGGRIVRHEWDLDGDGSLETDTGANPTATHTYLTGPVTVTLRVTDDRGQTATAKRLVVLQRFASLLRVRRSISRRQLRRGLALRVTVLPLARRVDVALYRAGRRARFGRRIARATLAIRRGGTVRLRWRLPARALRGLRPGRYVLRVQGRPTSAHAPILRSIRIR